jgi:hypothetical protein
LTLEALFSSFCDEINGSFGAQVDIQQNHGCAATGKFREGRHGGSTLAYH